MAVTVREVKMLRKIREELIEIAEQEASKLYRLARKAKAHDCSNEMVEAIRSEAGELHMIGYPERLLDPDKAWRFAFK